MLNGIKSEAIKICKLCIPFAPSYKLFPNLLVIKVNICAHKIIIIIKLLGHTLIPLLSIKKEKRFPGSVLIPVYSVKMLPIPRKIRILTLSARKSKLGPCTDCFTVSNHLIAAIFIELLRCNLFNFISPYFMIEYNIRIYIDILIVKSFNCIKILILGSVFCRY